MRWAQMNNAQRNFQYAQENFHYAQVMRSFMDAVTGATRRRANMTLLISVQPPTLPDTCNKRRINDNGGAKFAVTRLVTIITSLGTT